MNKQWYYETLGEELGPVTSSELKSLAAKKVIDRDTIIRCGERRVAAYTIKGLISSETAPVEATVQSGLSGEGNLSNVPPIADHKTFPYCAETIRSAAIKCKHCWADLGIKRAATQSLPNGSELQALADDSQIFMRAFCYWFFGSLALGVLFGAFNLPFALPR